MNFVLSKVLWIFAQPLQVILFLGALGLVLSLTAWARFGQFLLWASLVSLMIICWSPLGPWALSLLERRFPVVQSLPSQIDGIVILGGSTPLNVVRRFGQPALNDTAERVVEGMTMARRYPNAKIIYTGGTSEISPPDTLGESDVAKQIFSEFGLSGDRFIFENQSRNTWENALYSKNIANPQPGEVWVLITSASHMPRAKGVFDVVGWSVLPYPVDFTIPGWRGGYVNPLRQLTAFQRAFHETLGLVAYYWMGRTSAVFPGPCAQEAC